MNDQTSSNSGYAFRPWKIRLLALAGLMIIAGGILAVVGPGEPAPQERDAQAGGAGSSLASTSFVDGVPAPEGPIPEVEPAPEPEGAWSPALLRGGISFLVAFSLAFAMRTVLRLVLVFVGVWGASLFYMQHLGWVEVNWEAIDTAFNAWAESAGDQFSSMHAFVTGSLPSAGLAGLGLFTGFKKR